MTTTVTPMLKKRLKIFNAMKPATQDVAKFFEEKLGNAARGNVLIMYDLGCRVLDMTKKPTEYGDEKIDGIKQLAEYFGHQNPQKLQNLRTFAERFSREFVKEYATKPMSSGQYMSLEHWMHVMLLLESKDRERMIDRVLKESLSSTDLKNELKGSNAAKKAKRSSGRKPHRPTSPVAGLQHVLQVANKFSNFEETMETSVFDLLDSWEPDKVEDALLDKLTETEESLESLVASAGKALKRTQRSKTRVERILEKRAAKAEANGEAEEEEAPKKKKKKQQPSDDATPVKKKKKKKKVRPAAPVEEAEPAEASA